MTVGTTTDRIIGVEVEAAVAGVVAVDTTIHGETVAAAEAAAAATGVTIWVGTLGILLGLIKVDSQIKGSTIWA